MADILPKLLLASLTPQTRKDAENQLEGLARQPQSQILPLLLHLVLNSEQVQAVRLAGAIFLKNLVRRGWDEDDDLTFAGPEKAQLRAQLLPAMIALSSTTAKNLRAQVAEMVSIISQHDFPENWPDLVDQLVASLSPSPSAYHTNLSVLETAHSIFGRWRSEIRTDALYGTINFVLSRFIEPFLAIFRYTANTLLSSSSSTLGPPELAVMAKVQVVLTELFYDLTCQDLPPALEDAHKEFFAEEGWFVRFLQWDPEQLRVDDDEVLPSLPSQIKTRIFEIAELYVHRFSEVLSESATVGIFLRYIWSALSGGNCSQISNDQLVAQALRFLSTAIRSGNYNENFATAELISTIVEMVIVPNLGLRDHEVEQFEDDPLEYIRLDLSLSSTGTGGLTSEGTTRRQAAADVLRALVSSGFEEFTTGAAGTWINQGLTQYSSNPTAENAWRSKDVAVYMLTAVATRGTTTQQGVTSTNVLVDVVQFFSNHVFGDLQAEPGTVHPILQVDAIRFILTFRNQLTKEQLLSVLPYLIQLLNSSNYVCYSYAAITIERILFIKRGTHLLFDQSDVRETAPSILNALLLKIESGRTPEKVAENDYLIKCVMRVILTAKQTLTPTYEPLLQRLIAIVGAICKNPSNPNFDQYIFESISTLIRFIVAGNSQTLPVFERHLFGPLSIIIQEDIEQYVPYVYQIFSQLLDLHKDGVPADYRTLLSSLFQPAAWQHKGSIPGLVRLLKGFLKHDAAELVKTNQFVPVLAVIQQRLIPSRVHDVWGFELLRSIVQNIPPATLSQYMKSIVTMLLTRLQTAKTADYSYHIVFFFLFVMAIENNGLAPDFMVTSMDQVQPGLWPNILQNIILREVPRMIPGDRKTAVVGLTRLLTESDLMLSEANAVVWPSSISALRELVSRTQQLQSAQSTEAEDPDEALRSIDVQEQGAVYQVAYSKLAASESTPEDPVASVTDVGEFVRQRLSAAARDPRRQPLFARISNDADRAFITSLTS